MGKGKRRHAHVAQYCEQGFDPRSRIPFVGGRPVTHYCLKHQFTAKRAGSCPTCREPLKSAGLTARPPKKGSKEWETFEQVVAQSHPKGCR